MLKKLAQKFVGLKKCPTFVVEFSTEHGKMGEWLKPTVC